MSNIYINHEDLINHVLEDWFVEEIGSEFVKHDVTRYTVIFKKEDKHYKLHYEHSYNNGIEDYYAPYTAHEVFQQEVTITKWVKKNV